MFAFYWGGIFFWKLMRLKFDDQILKKEKRKSGECAEVEGCGRKAGEGCRLVAAPPVCLF